MHFQVKGTLKIRKIFPAMVEITLRHGCSPVNLLLIFRTPFTKNTSERLLLAIVNVSRRGETFEAGLPRREPNGFLLEGRVFLKFW